MPIKIYRRPGSQVYSYRGTVAGRRLRGSTGTTDKIRAAKIAAKKETEQWQCDLDGPQAVLTFAKASLLYRAAGKEVRYLTKIEDYWKDMLIGDIKAGAIKQSAIDIYPVAGPATRNRQVITPTQAVINHCAELELCAPIRVRRFKFEKKIMKPILLDWLETFCSYADPQMKALGIFLFATGCRISEARRLQWADIDFAQRTILIRKTKTKSQRLPHMPDRLLVALANLPRDTAPFGNPESTLRRAWDAVIAKAASVTGFERLTFHRCRHGFATKLLQDGVDVVTVAKLGGWESPQQVLSTYAHAIQDATLTNRLFDTDLTRPVTTSNKNKGLA